jgi:hypothetical protein
LVHEDPSKHDELVGRINEYLSKQNSHVRSKNSGYRHFKIPESKIPYTTINKKLSPMRRTTIANHITLKTTNRSTFILKHNSPLNTNRLRTGFK